jgi:hypothetical protein
MTGLVLMLGSVLGWIRFPELSAATLGLLLQAFLMHMVEDAFLIQLFIGNHIQIVPGTDWLISPMNGLLMSLFFIALGLGLRPFRKRRMSPVSKSDLRSLPEAV